MIPSISDINNAAIRIKPYIHRTPVLTSQSINQILDGDFYFKCENFQKTGAFKFRGASNALFSIPADDLKNGVATHSSGNHDNKHIPIIVQKLKNKILFISVS